MYWIHTNHNWISIYYLNGCGGFFRIIFKKRLAIRFSILLQLHSVFCAEIHRPRLLRFDQLFLGILVVHFDIK